MFAPTFQPETAEKGRPEGFLGRFDRKLSLLTQFMPKRSRDQALGIGDFREKTRLSSQKLRMTEDQYLVDYLLLLRFGTIDVGQASRPMLSYASISKIVKKPLSTFRDLIKRGIESKIKN